MAPRPAASPLTGLLATAPVAALTLIFTLAAKDHGSVAPKWPDTPPPLAAAKIATAPGPAQRAPEVVAPVPDQPTLTSRPPEAPRLRIARSYLGKSETEHAAVLGAFFVRMTGESLDPRETPWCAAFVNAVLKATGVEGTGSLRARSFLRFGTPIQTPQPGDIAVFARGDPRGQAGHVGFYAAEIRRSGQTYIRVIGGNQEDAVSERLYPKSQLLGYRRPPPSVLGDAA